jgi:hypothetical protein
MRFLVLLCLVGCASVPDIDESVFLTDPLDSRFVRIQLEAPVYEIGNQFKVVGNSDFVPIGSEVWIDRDSVLHASGICGKKNVTRSFRLPKKPVAFRLYCDVELKLADLDLLQ